MKRRRKNKKIENDGLSNLPDCVLLHILSFLNTKDAAQTCILSTRWKHLWKRLPSLTFRSSDFKTLRNFTKFVSRIFSLRDSSTALHDLDFHRSGLVEPHLLKRIVNYAVSHNVQRLRLYISCDIEQIPPCLFSSRTLTSLILSINPGIYPRTTTYLFPNSLNLPALTSLDLRFFTFCGGNDGRAAPFSSCNRLNSLTIDSCEVFDAPSLCISSTTLVNLTLHNRSWYYNCKSSMGAKIEISAPSLCRFSFTGIPLQKLYGSDLSSIKQVNIEADIAWYKLAETPLVLLSWLIELSDIKSLTVSSNTLQVLSLVPDLLKIKLASLCNLKSLKVKLKPLSFGLSNILRAAKLEQAAAKSPKEAAMLEEAFKEGLEPSSSIPDGIVAFLLQNSPSAKVDIIED